MIYRAWWDCFRGQLVILNRCNGDRKISYCSSLGWHVRKFRIGTYIFLKSKIFKCYPTNIRVLGRHARMMHPSLPWVVINAIKWDLEAHSFSASTALGRANALSWLTNAVLWMSSTQRTNTKITRCCKSSEFYYLWFYFVSNFLIFNDKGFLGLMYYLNTFPGLT